MMSNAASVGRSLTLAGVLMAVGVSGEWVLNPQEPDGSVTKPAVFAALVLASTVGWGLLAVGTRTLGRAAARQSRAVRRGTWLAVVGAGLLVVFGLAVVVTGLINDQPAGASFIAFGLGMLLLSVGSITLGLSLRRQSPATGSWVLLTLAGAATLVAIAAPVDAVHEISLTASFAAWTLLGLRLWNASATRIPLADGREQGSADRRHAA